MVPLREVLGGFRLHAEEGTAEIHHFPREEEREPGWADEGCRAGAEAGWVLDGLGEERKRGENGEWRTYTRPQLSL